MNSKSFITFCLSILVIVIIAAVVAGYVVYKNYEGPNTEQVSIKETIELVDTYDIVTPSYFGELTVHSKMYVVHDNDRNVTCWLYDDGISCIPDWFLEEVEK